MFADHLLWLKKHKGVLTNWCFLVRYTLFILLYDLLLQYVYTEVKTGHRTSQHVRDADRRAFVWIGWTWPTLASSVVEATIKTFENKSQNINQDLNFFAKTCWKLCKLNEGIQNISCAYHQREVMKHVHAWTQLVLIVWAHRIRCLLFVMNAYT